MIIQKLNRILIKFCAYLLAVMVAVAAWQVISRYVFNSPSPWTEEALRFQLIWLTLIGAPLAQGLNRQMAVTFFIDRLSKKRQRINDIFVQLVILIFAVLILIIGGGAVAFNASGQVSASMGLDMMYVYIALPISGILFAVYTSAKLIEIMKIKGEN